MIKNIIFDFGDIFIDLDKPVIYREMVKHQCLDALPQLELLNSKYEIGLISPEEFIRELKNLIPRASSEQLKDSWNAMLLDFPDYRLEFLENLAREGKYRLFLLSNTNALHIPHVADKMGLEKFERFRNSFEQFYLSHEIHLRKPDTEIFRYVLKKQCPKSGGNAFYRRYQSQYRCRRSPWHPDLEPYSRARGHCTTSIQIAVMPPKGHKTASLKDMGPLTFITIPTVSVLFRSF